MVFSPALSILNKTSEKYASKGLIEFSVFANVLLKYFRGERRQRVNSIKLLIQSRIQQNAHHEIDLDSFQQIVSTTFAIPSYERVLDLYRVTLSLGNGKITYGNVITAMDVFRRSFLFN